MHEKWQIQLLGGLAAQREAQVINHFRTQKTAALLAYLAYYPQAHGREALIELLWPGNDPAKGRESLRTALAALRRQFESDEQSKGTVFEATHQLVRLKGEAIVTDVAEFEAALESGAQAACDEDKIKALTTALKHYRGPLLSGYYDDWMALEEERLTELFCRAVQQLIELLLRNGNTAEALERAQAALALHPLHEDLQCTLLRLYALNGQAAAALQQYEQFCKQLRQWDAVPGDAMRRLAEEIARESARPGNLPTPRVRLVGRDHELAVARQLVQQEGARLLTFTGPGGVGKTTLALKVASELASEFPDGAFLVALAAIQDPAMVLSFLATTLGVQEQRGVTLLRSLQDFLRHKKLLLLLDNFEQVTGAALLITELLAVCPQLHVLVTSRIALGLWGEQNLPVPPLDLPDLQAATTPEQILASPALQLFVQRARAVQPSFAVTPASAVASARLCTHLDGLPLAIELAASQLGLMSVQELLDHLADRFHILRTSAPDLPPRQRTLRQVIDWSYELLTDAQRRVLTQLAVFAGGFTLAAAADTGRLSDALQELEALYRHSLLQAQDSPITHQRRFWMLESVHAYATEKLQLDKLAMRDIQGRHAIYFLEFAEQRIARMRTVDEAQALDQLEEESANLRAALAWAHHSDQPLLCIRLALALHQVLLCRGYWTEARQTLEIGRSALAGLTGDARPWQALLAYHRASFAHDMGDLEQAHADAQTCLNLRCAPRDEISDGSGIADALNLLGLIATDRGELDEAQRYIEQSLQLRAAADALGHAKAIHNLARIAARRGDLQAARSHYQDSLVYRRSAGDVRGEAATLGSLGTIAFHSGDYEGARALYQSSLDLYRQLGNRQYIATMLNNLAEVAEVNGQLDDAVALFTQAELIFHVLNSPQAAAMAASLQRLSEKSGGS